MRAAILSLIGACMHLPAAPQAVRMAKRYTGGTLRDDVTVLVIDLLPTRPDARAGDAAAPSFLDVVAQATAAAAAAAPKPRPARRLLSLFSRPEGSGGARKGSGASVAPLPLEGTLQLLADIDTWRAVSADAGGLQYGQRVGPTSGEARLMLPAASLQESQPPSPHTPKKNKTDTPSPYRLSLRPPVHFDAACSEALRGPQRCRRFQRRAFLRLLGG